MQLELWVVITVRIQGSSCDLKFLATKMLPGFFVGFEEVPGLYE